MWFRDDKNFNSDSQLDVLSRRLLFKLMVNHYSFVRNREQVTAVITEERKHLVHTVTVSMDSPDIVCVHLKSIYTSPKNGVEYTLTYVTRELTVNAKEAGSKGIVYLVRSMLKKGMKMVERDLKARSRQDRAYHKLSFLEYIKYKLTGKYPKITFSSQFINAFKSLSAENRLDFILNHNLTLEEIEQLLPRLDKDEGEM